jgi:hypothetical protein
MGRSVRGERTAINQVIKAFEEHISHEDLDTAIENGLRLDPDVNRALLEVAKRQDGPKGDITAIRNELMKVNEGSPRYQELLKALEAGDKKLYGTRSSYSTLAFFQPFAIMHRSRCRCIEIVPPKYPL